MSNNNYTHSAAALCDQLDATIAAYLSSLEAEAAAFPYAAEELEDIRYTIARLRSAIPGTLGTIGLLRYVLEPGELRSRNRATDPWSAPATRRSLRKSHR